MGLLWWLSGKEFACNAGDLRQEEGNGNLLQYACLENPMDGGAWQATVHGIAESNMTAYALVSTLNI